MIKLEKLFSDILYTTENPAIFENISIYKEGKEIKRVKKVEKFELTSNDLLSELRKGKKKNIDFYQKGIKRIFKKYNSNNVIKELSKIDTYKKGFVIINSKIEYILPISNYLNIIIDDRLNDEIIIGSKLSKCVLNKETGEYYIDIDSLMILNLI